MKTDSLYPLRLIKRTQRICFLFENAFVEYDYSSKSGFYKYAFNDKIGFLDSTLQDEVVLLDFVKSDSINTLLK